MRLIWTLGLAIAGFSALSTNVLAADRVYIPLGSAGEILAVNAENGKTLGRVRDVPDVHGLAGTGDGRLLIAGSYSETKATDSAMPSRPKGVSESDHLAHHAPRTSKTTTESDFVSFVSIIDAEALEVIRRIRVPGAVHHVLATPDNKYAVLTHPNRDGVSIIDLTRMELVKSLRTGSLPNYAVATPDGEKVFVTNSGDNTLAEIDTRTWTKSRTIRVGEAPEHVVINPNGKTLYVNNVDSGTVSVVDVPTGNINTTYEIGGMLHGVDISEDGRTLYVSALEREVLAAVDLKSGTIREAGFSPAPYHLAVVDESGKLFLSSIEQPKVWIVDTQTLKAVGEIPVSGEAHQMVVME